MGKKIIWTASALLQLEDIHFYLLFESKSISVADKVIDTIFKSTEILKLTPEIYEYDSQMINNDGSFRAYFIYDYKISYRITNEFIQILRVRPTSRKPQIL
ncbi:MAG: type II toxin-antitoxin system RelE/ParE family toxin [Flavobacterium sp.]|nr:type II toxin-antitoxin system RelE/ParE family toxin [Flavobacterium sp.]